MKKTLIALAVLAASGASFAQATVTGSYGFGFTNNLAQVKGFGSTDGGLALTNTEDLGGGMKAVANISMDLRGRNSSFSPTDATVSLAGGFGVITMGAVESANTNNNRSGAPVSLDTGIDGGIIDGAANVDYIGWSIPVTSAFTIGLTYADSIGAPGFGADGSSSAGVPPAAGAASLSQSYGLSGAYAAGPLSVSLGYTAFLSKNNASTADGKTRLRLAGSYDLGVAKIGAGVQTVSETTNYITANGSAGNQFTIDFAVPMGAATFGMQFASREANGNNAAGVVVAGKTAANGWTAGVDYNLSKQTKVNVSVGSYSVSGSDIANQYRVKLLKSF